jgi:predicted ATPase/class 3 adenylate cyclase
MTDDLPRQTPSGTVTFLFTDIEGSTRRWQDEPDAMRSLLVEHDSILREVITKHHGHLFKHTGDGVAVAFSSATDAVVAAADAQARLAYVLPVRMGLHTGEAELRDGDYFGTTLNRCARLMGVAHGRQIVCSAATAELVRDRDDLRDLGEHRLRDLSRAEHVWQIGRANFAPLRSLGSTPGNLPSQLTSFVGRESDVERVIEALRSTRVVTLTGVGGVGKTRLALQAAASISGSFPDGAWFVELAALGDADAIERIVALTFDLGQQQGRSLRETLADFFADKHMLIVVDNCEHLLEASRSMVDALLHSAPHLVVVITSREALGVDGERVIMVRSLSMPDVDDPAPGSYESVELFVDRARATRDDFLLSKANSGAVSEIVRRLDGIPLAIELAAARVRSMAPVDIAARLNERFRLLTGGRKAALERHQTLRAAVSWSVDLLNDVERTAFFRLGVFSGTFDLAAVESVATEVSDVVDVIDVLVARSLVVAEEVDGRVRYRLLETLRQFAVEQLDVDGSADDVRHTHAEHYAGVVARLAPRMVGPDELVATFSFLAEIDNLRAAVEWAVAANDAELALRLVGPVPWLPLFSSAPYLEMTAWAESVVSLDDAPRYPLYRTGMFWLLASANLAGDTPTLMRLCDDAERALDRAGHAPSGVPAYNRGLGFMALGEYDASLAEFERAIALIRTDDDPVWLAWALATVASLRVAFGRDSDDVAALGAEAVAIAKRSQSPSLIAMCVFLQATSITSDGDRSFALLDEALTWSSLSPNPAYESMARAQRAKLAFERGEAGALQGYLPVLREMYRGGYRMVLQSWLWNIVPILARSGLAIEAAELAGALDASTVADVQRYPGQEDDTALRAELGEEAFALAHARGAARSYREVMDHVFAVIERDASDGVV